MTTLEQCTLPLTVDFNSSNRGDPDENLDVVAVRLSDGTLISIDISPVFGVLTGRLVGVW